MQQRIYIYIYIYMCEIVTCSSWGVVVSVGKGEGRELKGSHRRKALAKQ